MISHKLQSEMHLMEMAMLPTYLKSDAKSKKQIIKTLARIEADMILKEIKEQAEKI